MDMFLDYVDDNESCYYILFKAPLMIKMNIESRCCDLHRLVDEKNGRNSALYHKTFKYKNKILFIPLHASQFTIFDCEKEELRYIPIPCKEIANVDYGYFCGASQNNNIVYVFGLTYPGIVKVDMEEEGAELFFDLKKVDKASVNFIRENIQVDNDIYIPLANSNKILKLNVISEDIEIIKLELSDNKLYIETICFDGKNIWMLLNDRTMIRCNTEFIILEKVDKFKDIIKKDNNYINSGCMDGKIFLFSCNDSKVFVFSCTDIFEYKWLHVPMTKKENMRYIYSVDKMKDRIYFYSESMDRVYSYDVVNERFEESRMQLTYDEYAKLLISFNDNIIEESENISIDWLIKNITK